MRHYANAYQVNPNQYKGKHKSLEPPQQYLRISLDRVHPHINHGVIYDPRKCISCGLCIQIAESVRESHGLTFIGRGFDIRVGVPFDRSIEEGPKEVGEQCADACPTGALVRRIARQQSSSGK